MLKIELRIIFFLMELYASAGHENMQEINSNPKIINQYFTYVKKAWVLLSKSLFVQVAESEWKNKKCPMITPVQVS